MHAMKHSAGLFVYRRVGEQLEVLLVHPSGNYNRHKPWSIPKGLPDEGESLEDAARRETQEEAGVTCGDLTPLGTIDYTKSKKRIHVWATPWTGDEPSCASWEVDCVEFLPLNEAREKIHPEQRPFLERLCEML